MAIFSRLRVTLLEAIVTESNVTKPRDRWGNPHFKTGRNNFGNTHTTLIPGEDWHPLDGGPAPEYVPDDWDGVHVGCRLVGSFKTLAQLPGGHGPVITRGFWPEYWPDWEDLLAQEGQADVKAEAQARANRVRLRPNAQEIGRMERALSWSGTYLSQDVHLAQIVQRVAFYRSLEKELDYAAMRLRIDFRIVREQNRNGLDIIAAGLRRDRTPVF
jgi:hypothetical protein